MNMEEFVYMGNGQRVPRDVVYVRFDPSVTEVETDAFDECRELRKVILNDGLTKIGAAFWRCTSLHDITIPSTVTEIDHSAFYNCNSLREVRLHEGLQTIGDSAFEGCSSLESVTLPSTLTDIGDSAFQNCNRLREVVLHNEGIKKIYLATFADCTSLQSIIIPSTVTEIGHRAFARCRDLREVRLHEGLQTIETMAFLDCTLLERFTFPTLSTRLNNVVMAETEVNRILQLLNEIDAIRGDMIQRNIHDLFVPGAVIRGGSNWNSIKASLEQIVSWIRYHEIKKETTLLELALWKVNIDQSGVSSTDDRMSYRVEVPGPVKDAILQYLW